MLRNNIISIFCSSSNTLPPLYYEEADRLGRWMGSHGKTLVYGGSNYGLMETLAKAVHEAGGKVIGIVPQILIDRKSVSAYNDESIQTQDLNDRKRKMIEMSDILIALPGGIGTLDEAFTVMSANTIGIHAKKVVFWNINGFWNDLFSMLDHMALQGVIKQPLGNVVVKADTLEDIVRIVGE